MKMTLLQSESVTSGNIPIGALWLLLVGGLVGGGCLSKPAFNRQTFAFQNPTPASTAPANGVVLAIRSVTVSPLFGGQPFIYRTGPVAYETDSYASFLTTPDQAVAIAVRSHLLGCGRFQDVVDRNGLVTADKSIEVQVSELYGDFSQPDRPAAVLSMRISWFDANDARGRPSALPKNYSRRIPLRKNTATEVMTGWDTALGEIMAEVAGDLSGGPGQKTSQMDREGQIDFR